MENIRVRLAPGIYGGILRSISMRPQSGGIKPCDNAAFGVEPQGYGVANRLAARVRSRRRRLKTLPVWRYRGRGTHWQGRAHAIVVTSPRNWVRRRPPVEPR